MNESEDDNVKVYLFVLLSVFVLSFAFTKLINNINTKFSSKKNWSKNEQTELYLVHGNCKSYKIVSGATT